MACKTKPRTYMGAIITDGTTGESFQPLGHRMAIADFEKVSVSLEVQSRTSGLSVRPGLRYSDNGVDWDAPQGLGSASTTTGWTYGGFNAVSSGKRFVQFGAMASNDSGSKVEKGSVALQLMFQG